MTEKEKKFLSDISNSIELIECKAGLKTKNPFRCGRGFFLNLNLY